MVLTALWWLFQDSTSIMCTDKVRKPWISKILDLESSTVNFKNPRPWKVGQGYQYRNSSNSPIIGMFPKSVMNLASLCAHIRFWRWKVGQGHHPCDLENRSRSMILERFWWPYGRKFSTKFEITAALWAKFRSGHHIFGNLLGDPEK